MKRILRFTADWCNPCKQLKENIERAALKTPIEVIDIEVDNMLATEFGVRNLPTMVLMDENTEISRVVGLKTPKQIKEWVGE
jgi:thioredoxin-like negative regulator of GroEL